MPLLIKIKQKLITGLMVLIQGAPGVPGADGQDGAPGDAVGGGGRKKKEEEEKKKRRRKKIKIRMIVFVMII